MNDFYSQNEDEDDDGEWYQIYEPDEGDREPANLDSFDDFYPQNEGDDYDDGEWYQTYEPDEDNREPENHNPFDENVFNRDVSNPNPFDSEHYKSSRSKPHICGENESDHALKRCLYNISHGLPTDGDDTKFNVINDGDDGDDGDENGNDDGDGDSGDAEPATLSPPPPQHNSLRDAGTLESIEVFTKLEKAKRHFKFEREFMPSRMRFSWEQFLVLQFVATVAYITHKQSVRFLVARQKHFEPEIKSDPSALNALARRGFVKRFDEPVVFNKGIFKGRALKVYYLTARGRRMLAKFDSFTAMRARFDEPKPAMRNRIPHEILMSEIYLGLVEEGNWVYWLMPEEALRSEVMKKAQVIDPKTRMMRLKALGDFRTCYLDAASGRKKIVDGEIAVRYTRDQIAAKPENLLWYCYDLKEASKIEQVTGKTARILGDKLFDDRRKRGDSRSFAERADSSVTGDGVAVVAAAVAAAKGSEPESQKFLALDENGKLIYTNLNDWLDLLGGFMIQSAAYLGDVNYYAARRKLKKREDLAGIYEHLHRGLTRGRGVKLYVRREYKSDTKMWREILLRNLAIHYLHERGFEFNIEYDATAKANVFWARNVVFDKSYAILFDAEYRRSEDEWAAVTGKRREEIKRAGARGRGAILFVADDSNERRYEREPECCCEMVNVSKVKFRYYR